MKPILYPLIFILSLILVGCVKEPVDQDDLVEREGLWYEKFSKEPYTGEMVDWSEEGQLKGNGFYENGKKEGLWELFEKSGSSEKGSYKNNKKEGIWEIFYKDGSLSSRLTYKDGKPDGLYETFHKDGSLSSRSTFKDGNRDGLLEGFFKDGSLSSRSTYKDGKLDGLLEQFYRDGTLKHFKECYQNNFLVDMSFCEGEQNNE